MVLIVILQKLPKNSSEKAFLHKHLLEDFKYTNITVNVSLSHWFNLV